MHVDLALSYIIISEVKIKNYLCYFLKINFKIYYFIQFMRIISMYPFSFHAFPTFFAHDGGRKKLVTFSLFNLFHTLLHVHAPPHDKDKLSSKPKI